jgi:hypothetical protein
MIFGSHFKSSKTLTNFSGKALERHLTYACCSSLKGRPID